MRKSFSHPISMTDFHDEEPRGKNPGVGGRVRGGTEARASKRASRRILDATDDTIKSNRFSSRLPQQIEWFSAKS